LNLQLVSGRIKNCSQVSLAVGLRAGGWRLEWNAPVYHIFMVYVQIIAFPSVISPQ